MAWLGRSGHERRRKGRRERSRRPLNEPSRKAKIVAERGVGGWGHRIVANDCVVVLVFPTASFPAEQKCLLIAGHRASSDSRPALEMREILDDFGKNISIHNRPMLGNDPKPRLRFVARTGHPHPDLIGGKVGSVLHVKALEARVSLSDSLS